MNNVSMSMRQKSDVEDPSAGTAGSAGHHERRRSERVFLQVGVFVQGVTPEGHAFREKTRTLAVNVHGALIHLAEDVRANDDVTLTHALTGQQQTCRVVYTQPVKGNIRAVGLEFREPAAKFWQIAFPPADWTPYDP